MLQSLKQDFCLLCISSLIETTTKKKFCNYVVVIASLAKLYLFLSAAIDAFTLYIKGSSVLNSVAYRLIAIRSLLIISLIKPIYSKTFTVKFRCLYIDSPFYSTVQCVQWIVLNFSSEQFYVYNMD